MTPMSKSDKIRCAVVGASGYAGLETLRLLSGHQNVIVTLATSNSLKGKTVRDEFPHTGVPANLKYEPHDSAAGFDGADVFFLALPHGKSFDMIDALLSRGKVVDISADYRLSNPEDYVLWYGMTHPRPDLLEKAVFGLSEIYRDKVRKAELLANPGCYPTSVGLAVHPLSKIRDRIGDPVIIDSKSGYSGAGRSLKPHLLFCEATNEFTPYAVTGHRHTSEMLQESKAALGREVRLTFTPHLIPVSRGILSMIYVPFTGKIDEKELRKIYSDFYEGEQFVTVLPEGKIPSIKQAVGTNSCLINVFVDEKPGLIKLVSAIDNLVKGAAGQAIQNMNIMFGLPEGTGLSTTPWIP